MPQPNQHAVARLAGVSQSTVSLVFTNRARGLNISEEVIHRVQKAAEELGYRRNRAARTLRLGRSFAVGFVCQWHNSTYWNAVAHGVELAACEYDHDLIRVADGNGAGAWSRALDFVGEHRLDALILGGRLPLETSQLAQMAVPVVWIEPFMPAGGATVVSLDALPALNEAMTLLLSLRHRDVMWVGGSDRLLAVRQPAAANQVRCRHLEIPPVARELGPLSAVKADLEARFPWDDPPTAVFCYNDYLALAMLGALRNRGLRVPADMSVVGFDDLYADLALPPLTTISYEFAQMGRKAMEVALSQVTAGKNADATPRVYKVPARLIIRGSTGPARS